MKPLALVAISILIAAACGGGSSRSKSTGTGGSKGCRTSIGIEAPTTGRLTRVGEEQLAFARLAVANDNKSNGTHISLVQGNPQPTSATTVAGSMIANSNIVAVVGPAGSDEVEAAGPMFGRAGMAFVSGTATKTSLTDGANPTFFRVVAMDSVQGPEVAHFVISKLHPKALMIIDDQQAYSTGLVGAMIPIFRAAGIAVDHESVGPKATDFSPLGAKITPRTTVAVLPWQAASNAERFGKGLVEQGKHVTIVGTDHLYSPSSFTVAGSYVSSLGPDITAIRSDASLVRQARAALMQFGTFGPPMYAATHVVDEAIASACKSGGPSRSGVLAAIKATDEPTSILGQPIKFDSHGDLINGKWFLFHINSSGQYQLMLQEDG
jgi:branched-chain amino acid transport system substrate-binding protein